MDCEVPLIFPTQSYSSCHWYVSFLQLLRIVIASRQHPTFKKISLIHKEKTFQQCLSTFLLCLFLNMSILSCRYRVGLALCVSEDYIQQILFLPYGKVFISNVLIYYCGNQLFSFNCSVPVPVQEQLQ